MTLKLTLRVGEAIHIGKLRLVVEAKSTCTIFIDGSAPVLRETEYVRAADTDPITRLRYPVQQMYLEGDPMRWLPDYLAAAKALAVLLPEEAERIGTITAMVTAGEFWAALRAGRQLSRRQIAVTRQKLAS
jgi:flagellar biosynthesis regulator FlbT